MAHDALIVIFRFWSKWGLRISVLGSLAAYILLALLSGVRRRSASGRWSSRLMYTVPWIIGAAYQGAEMAATSAVGSLSLCDASVAEQEVIAFWGPFLLLHLAGPDNITASTLEDTKLSVRIWAEMALRYFRVGYAIVNYLYYSGSHNSRVLFAAAFIMVIVGWARYVERALALLRANLAMDSMVMVTTEEEDSSSKKGDPGSGVSGSSCSIEVVVGSRTSKGLRRELDDVEALLLAQDLFPIWRRALVDSAVNPGSAMKLNGEKIFSLGWRSMCKVVEMELSLMYEVLYTKALMAHTWTGYLLRFLSPIGT